MRRGDFHYELPPELIAQHPLPERAASRLLCLDGASGALADRVFRDLPALLEPGDLLVFNDTRVIPARLLGHKPTGGRVEVLIERVLDEYRALAHIGTSKTPRPGTVIEIDATLRLTVRGRQEDLFEIEFSRGPVLAMLEEKGHVPLPPYVVRPDSADDRERYQTIYAREAGAVAAPTAGLHFDADMLATLEARGVRCAFVTLHVGAGTFQPVRVENLAAHRMHSERFEVSAETATAVREARAAGHRVVAVGTTTIRALESAAASGELHAFRGETALFITPGYRFRCVDALLTNFHLPESTLLMLVAAFGGYRNVMAAYHHAVSQRYRFYSYGDAMFVTIAPEARADAV
ncbi:MAG TPA: tRNA preQ1(34) S-adenosylmethionine ribosyltransferase-isomerase QueA [Gammaproteobacteria bacterium]|nr:tRNA preQ1(34) S-adenosylmethionine ribosyltransferase-isomerase QueA [Gammaproteobacteria bacterium]